MRGGEVRLGGRMDGGLMGLKERLIEVERMALCLRLQESCATPIVDYLQGCVERAREELERGIEWAIAEVFWVGARRGDRDEEEAGK